MKKFWGGIGVGVVSSFIVFLIGNALSQPFVLYQINEQNNQIVVRIKNFLFGDINHLCFEAVMYNDINVEPFIKNTYLSSDSDLTNYLTKGPAPNGIRIQFDDKRELGVMGHNAELHLVFSPAIENTLNMVISRSVSAEANDKAIVIRLESLDDLAKYFWMGLFLIVSTALIILAGIIIKLKPRA